MSTSNVDQPDVDFIQAPGCVKMVMRLGLDSKPVKTSILKNYEDIVTDEDARLVLPGGCSDGELVAWVSANKFGSRGMGMGTLAMAVKVSF